MAIRLHKRGEMHATDLINHGKVADGPWSFDGADRDSLLGPKGTHVDHYAAHHLGEDDSAEEGDHKRYRYPVAKEGRVYRRALDSVVSRAKEHGHDEVRASAESLIAMIEAGGGDTDHDAHTGDQGKEQGRSERRIVKEGEKYYVKSEDGSKNLGGPYGTEEEAKKRLAEVDYFKAKEEKSTPPDAEQRCWMLGLELRNLASQDGSPGTVVGYAAVFDRFSQDLGAFKERIAPGAFAACMAQDVRALANHDPQQLLGRSKAGTLRMREDHIGLRVEIDLPDTQTGRDIATSIRRGDMDGMSFSFTTDSDQWDYSSEPPIRTLLKVRSLYDVGPVTYPAYTDTSAAMRSLERSKPTPPTHRAEADPLSLAKARQRLAEALST